jgi:hypothetical protein
MNRSTLIQLVLLLVLIACLAACDNKEVRSSSENTSASPKQDPDSEYPGTKEHDSLKKANPDVTLEAKGNQGHPAPH